MFRIGVEITVAVVVAVVMRCNFLVEVQAYAEHAFLPFPKLGGARRKGQQGIQWGLLPPHKAAEMTPPQLGFPLPAP